MAFVKIEGDNKDLIHSIPPHGPILHRHLPELPIYGGGLGPASALRAYGVACPIVIVIPERDVMKCPKCGSTKLIETMAMRGETCPKCSGQMDNGTEGAIS